MREHLEYGELRWLAKRRSPVWQGVLRKMEGGDNSGVDLAVVNAFHEGLIEIAGEGSNRGFILSVAGRQKLGLRPVCPTCGALLGGEG